MRGIYGYFLQELLKQTIAGGLPWEWIGPMNLFHSANDFSPAGHERKGTLYSLYTAESSLAQQGADHENFLTTTAYSLY